MKNDEDVLTYTGRVEQLYYNLCNATLANKTPEEARILRQTLKDQALAIYINGLQMDLQIGHDSVSCYSKQRDERNNANRTGNGQVSNRNGVPNLLLDTGSEINLIKISKLTGETIVNENEKINLKGINDKIKGEFLGYLCDMIQREKHNVTTFLRRDEAPSCLRSHMENANKKLSEPYSKSEIERYTKNITVFIHDVYEKNDLREQFCIVINDWLDAMPEADEMFLCIMMVQGQSPYTIEEFKNETSIFYENQGEIRIIGAHWELITYIPLSNYDLRHYQLELEIKHMDEHCKGNMTDHEMCSKYDNVLKTTFNEISVQRTQMYESIGRYLLPTGEHTTLRSVRSKRGLINIIGSAMKTLFGVCDEECAEETLRHIDKVEGTNERMIHVIKDQTTVVKSSIIGINSASTELNKLYIELKQKQISLETNIKALINNTYTLETLLLSNRIFSIFTALMTQYSYETQTLSAIITAARTGVLHPSLVTPRELAAQLVDVKLNLPLNLNLPMEHCQVKYMNLQKSLKLHGSQIVFLIKIPLITETQLTLFKIIPIPHPVGIDRADNKTHSIVLKPEYQYVGITKNRRQFTTFTETELLHCTETETFTICPEFQPVQHESKDQPCEISLFKNPDQLPQNCESGVIVISKNIFHKLKYANTWIYTTRKDTLTITCQGVPEPYIEKIKNQGIIKLNQECSAYAEHVVLYPTREIKTRYFTNFIPKIGVGNISYKINNSIKDIKIEKYRHKFDSGKLDNVHEMAHSLNEVENMIDEEILRQSGVEVYKCKLTTMRAIGHRTRTTNDDVTNKERKIVYVKSPAKENKAKEKLLEKRHISSKLEGRPLLLPLNEEARPMGETELQVAVREIKRVFRVKTELRDACLDQLKQSLSSTKNNLTKGYIDSCIRRGNKENVIVVWNGHSDKNILKKLDLDHYPMLNITCYDKYFNKNFYIQFEKLITANENIIVPYEDETILEMIEAAKRFLSDMAVDREFGEPYCYELNYYFEIIQNPQDILNYSG
ncbi:hypothetical protein AGLY_017406 [Aphis glycines]|uniref:Peptidase A2 domain-containing protein n=1 Tax=Aphis glycines TaxID=307491 RepID=A0A6G0SUU2_APHGL|nr:hypothetical protein AGLY_017406 [Aphis glycines]